MNTPDHFEQAVEGYQGPVANCPQEILYSIYFFVFFETVKLFLDHHDEIDGLDWAKIYLKAQPDPALQSTSSGGGATQSNIDRLADIMTKNYKDAQNNKEEILIPYDSNTNTGVPKECIDRHNKRKKINYIVRKLEMEKFKNELTLDTNGSQQEQTFITSPVGGSQYLIYCDGTLYRYLLYQGKKEQQEYVKKFPFLMGWSPEEWVIF